MTRVVTEEMLIEANGKKIGGDSDYWIYLTNLKAYNEGILTGVYLHFPFTRMELNKAFEMIYVDSNFIDKFGDHYEEYFISDFEAPFDIGEYEYVPMLIEKYGKLEPYLNLPKEIINIIADNLESEFNIYELYGGGNNEEKLGNRLCEDGIFFIPEYLKNYIDYEMLGRDYVINSNGVFTDNYYIEFY